MMQDTDFMRLALQEAAQAAKEREVPVGAVLEYQGKVLARDHNRMVQRKDPLAHAELLVLESAVKLHPHRWLLESTMYVTLEPCVMCAGALVLSRVARLVFAASDPKGGACGSTLDIVRSGHLNHRLNVESGLFQEDASRLLKDFFQQLRHEQLVP